MGKRCSVLSCLEIREQNVCVHESCCKSRSLGGLGWLAYKDFNWSQSQDFYLSQLMREGIQI